MPSERYRFGPFELDLAAHRLSRDGAPIDLQPKAMELLAVLVRGPDRVHPRTELNGALWPDVAVSEHSLRQLLYKLREALGDQADLVQTVPRVGMRIAAPVLRIEERPTPGEAASGPGLPPEQGAFVGRRAELAALDASLAPLRTLVGPGGVGKTRLAVRYARTRPLEGGGWFCDLSGARTEDDVVSTVAAALDVPRLGEVGARVGHALAARGSCLVLLDNLEQVREPAGRTIASWMARAPRARFLATSRVGLGLPGEIVVAVEPLPEADGVALFRSRARRASDEPAVLGRLVRLLDGLPLAIELAARAVGEDGPEALIARLSDRFSILVGGGAGRHGALAATLDWSLQLLSPVERDALSQLAVFAGGLWPEAAEEVLDLPDGVSALDVLGALREQSLLHAGAEQRLDMLLSVREHVSARTEPRARAAAEARHGLYFAALGSEASLETLSREGGPARRRVWLADLDNLVIAARRAVARGDGEVACGVALAVSELTRRAGPLRLALELLQDAASCSGASERERERLCIATGTVLLELGRSEEAGPMLEQAHGWARRTGEPMLEALALQALAQYEHDRGRPDRAMARIRAALAVMPGAGGSLLEARLRSTAGAVALIEGRFDDACEELDRARVGLRAWGDRLNEARVALNLAIAHGQRGAIERSGEWYHEALRLMDASGDRVGLCVALASRAAWCDKVGRVDESRWYLESSLTLARELGDRRAEGIALIGLGRCSAVEDPRPFLEGALAIHRELGWDYGQAYALCGLARLELAAGRPDRATALTDEAVTRAGRYPTVRTVALVERAEVHLATERWAEARADLDEARALGVGGAEGAARWVAEARLALALGDRASARSALVEAERDPVLVAPGSDLGEAVARLRSALDGA